MLAKHKYSGVKLAVKLIEKANIASTFGAEGVSFNELELMEEVCRG